MINQIEDIIKYIEENLLRFTLQKNHKLYEYYIEAKKDLKNIGLSAITNEEIYLVFKNSRFLSKYLKLINNIQLDKIFNSSIHGINHNIRVSILIFIIANFEKVSKKEFEILIECAKYHDIGRTNDHEDNNHGMRSAEKITFLKNYNLDEMNLMKTIITCHSLNDSELDKYMDIYKIKNKTKCEKLFNILKDADGLDRVRLPLPYAKIELSFLRTKTAKRLVCFAFELYILLLHFCEKDIDS